MRLPGVSKAELNFGAAKLTVHGGIDSGLIVREARKHSVTAVPEGIPAVAAEQPFWEKNGKIVVSVFSGLFFLAGWTADVLVRLPVPAVWLYLAAMLSGGFETVLKAVKSLGRLSFDMNVLMTAAVTGAALIGEWEEAAAVAFLYSVSGALESYTAGKARQSIRSLMEIAPKIATVRRDGREMSLPVEEILLGDVLIVRPGEKIAMDGVVIDGSSTVNQAAITGESAPVKKTAGCGVFAGTFNQEGVLEVKVTKLVGDTTIARIISMVEEAQAQKAPLQSFIDRFAGYYTPAVIAAALLVSVLPPLVSGLPWYPWVYRGLALLVVGCPCALVISTPVAIVSAIVNAARNGVLIKGGVYLEEMGSLSVVAFDKTGTLTGGTPEVTDVIAVDGGMDEEELLRIAASVEKMSEHPLARAVVRKAGKLNLRLVPAAAFESFVGRGAKADLNGRRVVVGSPGLLGESGIDVSPAANVLSRLESEGKTPVMVGVDGSLAGVLALADTLRENGNTAVKRLSEMGIKKTVMLTGDNPGTAEVIAGKAGVDAFLAGLMPQDKVAAINDLKKEYGKVAMVGDGVNDAPALAAATVGIAMGGAGTDTALETADMVLMADDLSKLPFAVRLSRASLRVIRQNIVFSIAIKLAAVLLVFPGWLTLWLAILADMGASVIVTLNGIRLMGIKPDEQAGSGGSFIVREQGK